MDEMYSMISMTYDMVNNNEVQSRQISENISALREGAIKKFNEILKNHEKPFPVVSDGELDSFLFQVDNKMLLVAVVGEGSSGKSTLLNTFLRGHYLPTGVKRNTAVRIYIGHRSSCHQGKCQDPTGTCPGCPTLSYDFKRRNIICEGVDKIREKIDEINKQVDDNQSGVSFLVLHTYINAFDYVDQSDQSLTPYFIDSPGVEEFRDDVKMFYTIESSLVYIENYTRLLQKKDKIKNELALKSTKASLFFVVTCFDHYYLPISQKENNPDEDGVKCDVSAAISGVFSDDVYTVCGQWAFNAYCYKSDPTDAGAKRAIDRAFEDYGEEQDLTPDNMINVSGFERLESKLCESVRNTDMTDWEINVFTQCNELLERHISVGSELLKQIKTKASELKTSNEFNKIKIKRIQQYIKEFSDHCDEGNLLNLVKATVNIESFSNSAQPALNGAMIQFCHACKEKVKNQKYKFEEFEKDLENFKQKSASKAMQDNMSTEISSYVEQLKGDIVKKFQTLISCIQLDAEEVAFADKFQLDIGELPGVNVGGYGTSVRQKAQSHRRWLWGVAGVAGAAGASISGGFLWATLSTAVAVAFPPAAIAAPLVAGLVGTAWFGIKAWTTYDGDYELSEVDVDKLCEEFHADHKLKTIVTNYFNNEEKKCIQVVFEEVKEFAKEKKKDYDIEWKQKYIDLNHKLEENEKICQKLVKQINDLEDCMKQLNDCHSYSQEALDHCKRYEIDLF